jgi:hypothetical protein
VYKINKAEILQIKKASATGSTWPSRHSRDSKKASLPYTT